MSGRHRRLHTRLDLGSVAISEVQAREILALTGLEVGLAGWRLDCLNGQVMEFVRQFQGEQGLSPSAMRDRLGLIAKRTRKLLAVLPEVVVEGKAGVVGAEDFELDSWLTQGSAGCGDLAPLQGQLRSLLGAAEAAELRMQSRVNRTTAVRHAGDQALNDLLKAIITLYMVLFERVPGLCRRSPNKDGEGGDPTGPLLHFVESVLDAVRMNLVAALGDKDDLPVLLSKQQGEALLARLRRVIPLVVDDEMDE